MTRRPSSRSILGLVTSVGLVASSLFFGATPASAACSGADQKPVLRDVTINQGLGSYSPLVRGKQTIVVFFLSGPQCAEADEWVRVKSATLTVTSAEKTTTIPLTNSTPKTVVRFEQATQSNGFAVGHEGHPTFVVPGPALEPLTTSSFPATFSVKVDYDYVRITGTKHLTTTVLKDSTTAGYIPETFSALNGSPITAVVEKATLSKRILAVPLGLDPTDEINNTPLAAQFSDAAEVATHQALDEALMRFLPVKHGRTSLGVTGQDGGLRVSLLRNGRVKVPEAFTKGTEPPLTFCGTGAQFTEVMQGIRSKLFSFLVDYNTSQRDPDGQPSVQFVADRVMGLIDQAMWGSCAHGYAGIGTFESWVAVRYGTDPFTGNPSPRWTGAVAGQELGHNDGAVPCGIDKNCEKIPGLDRDTIFNPQHSQFSRADVTAPLRAYNILLPDYLNGALEPTENRTVMRLLADGTWDDNSTLYEKPDWELAFCKLGGPPTDDCGLYPQTTPSAAGAGTPAQTIAIGGTTDLTPAKTNVFTSYTAPGPTIPAQDASVIRIAQLSNGSLIREEGLPTSSLASIHEHGTSSATSGDLVYFYGEVELDAVTDRFEIRHGDTVLYARDKDGAPEIDGRVLVSTPDNPIPPDGERIDFDDDNNHVGDTITTEYEGVDFDNPDDSTPRISGRCPPDRNLEDFIPELADILLKQETPPCRSGDTASEPFSLRNNQALGKNTSLEMTFTDPQAYVGMVVGNGSGGTVATLQALDATGNPIKGIFDSESVALDVETPISISATSGVIHGALLTYDDERQEEIDNLVFSPNEAWMPDATTLIAHVTDDSPDIRMSWFGVCGHEVQPYDSGDSPDAVRGPNSDGIFRATFTFEPILDDMCINSGNHVFRARATDGFQTDETGETDEKDATIAPPAGVTSNPPQAVIAIPTGDLTVLENSPMPLIGYGEDKDEGTLPDDKLSWTIEGTGLSEPVTATGSTAYVDPPAGGWPVPAGQDSATYTVTLTVTDSDELSDTTSTEVVVLADDDADGVPRELERCSGGEDNDPRDQNADTDGDGLPNWADPDPCAAHDDFRATIVQIEPPQIVVPSQGGDFTVRFRLPFHDENAVDGKTVRIAEVGGIEVTGNEWFAKRTSVENGDTFVAKFSRQSLVDFLNRGENADLKNSDVLVAIVGEGIAPGGLRYSFAGDDQVEVREK